MQKPKTTALFCESKKRAGEARKRTMHVNLEGHTMSQKSWLITGINSGIGRMMTELLLGCGDRVAGTVRRLDEVNDLKARYRELLQPIYLDLTDVSSIRGAVDAAFSHFGQIDVIVNNAAYGLFGAAEEVTDEQIKHQVDTNLIGSIQVIRAALPYLRAQGGGRVLQVSSVAGQTSFPTFSLYHATKWGIEGFVEAVSKEVAPFNISFTIVEPGATDTNFVAGMVSPSTMDVYENTPVGEIRRAFASNLFPIVGDASRVAMAMIDSVDVQPAPLRLALGSDTYNQISGVLKERLAALEAQRQIAFSTDKDASPS